MGASGVQSESVLAYIVAHAEREPDRDAIVFDAERWSYRTLAQRIGAARRALALRGIGRGDRVVVEAAPSGGFVAVYFACHSLGAVAVPVGPRGLSPATTDSIAPALVTGARARKPAAGPPAALFDDLVSAGPSPIDPLELPGSDDTADIMLTSGTSGDAKTVLLTHANQVAAAQHINAFIGNGPEDRELLALPLHHSFGLGRLRAQLTRGGCVFLARGFSPPARILEGLERSKATVFAFVPAAWSLLRQTVGEEILPFARHIRFIEIGSAPMPVEDKRELLRWFPGARICMHYGLTEASRSCFLALSDDGDRLHSAGRPSPGVEISIRDRHGQPVSDGAEGEIWIRGGHVVRYDWIDRARVARESSWLASGDEGYVDEHGYVHVLGRADDIINVGGDKVHPAEVEAALRLHPAIAEAACVGVDDPDRFAGQRIAAFFVVAADAEAPGQDELFTLLKQTLEPHKIPVSFEQRDSLPRGDNGKLLRASLRQLHSGSG